MNNQKAIASLKTLCHTCDLFPKCVHEKPECFRAIELAISALQAQDVPDTNVGDMISRQAAIATVKNMREVCDTDDITDYYDLLIEAFNVLPSAQPEWNWIPVSERLPEEGQGCLVYDNGSILIDTFIGRGNPYNWKWYIRDYEAWMPLPEPYRAERRTDEQT